MGYKWTKGGLFDALRGLFEAAWGVVDLTVDAAWG